MRLADRAVRIGPPAAAESYLSIPALIAAAETTGCEAVHPGYGFVSENADFVRACEDNDLVFIGPPADVMERMGDKARAKAEMRDGRRAARSRAPRESRGAEDAQAAAAELGFPVLLKAAAGGGGKGMRMVTEPGELLAAYERAVGGGAGGVRRRLALRREGDHAGAPRRDPGALRRPWPLPHLRRARVLGPAPPPEADRGVALAGARRRAARGDGGRRRARVPAHRLPQCGHVRVPRRARRLVLLHRAQRAPPGRAPRHRVDRRDRPRPRAGADRGRRRARRTVAAPARAAAMRSSCGSTPRIPRAASPRRRDGSSASGRRSGPASASTRSSRTAP